MPDRPDARAIAQEALARVEAAREALTGLSTALEGGVQGPFEPPLAPGLTPAEWRAEHRRGTLSRLDTDADLRAFVLARLARLTFDQIVSEVAAAFPPERRVSRSALHRWWHRTGKKLTRQSADTKRS